MVMPRLLSASATFRAVDRAPPICGGCPSSAELAPGVFGVNWSRIAIIRLTNALSSKLTSICVLLKLTFRTSTSPVESMTSPPSKFGIPLAGSAIFLYNFLDYGMGVRDFMDYIEVNYAINVKALVAYCEFYVL